MTVVLASVRDQIANYVSVLAYVYITTIIVYIVVNWFFAVGLRIPYNRWSNAFLTFLRDVCEPYLRLFRRILPSFGGLDFSPIVGILVLYIVASLANNAISG